MDSSAHSTQLEQGPVAMVTDMQSDPGTPPSTSSGASSPASNDEPTSPLHEVPTILPPTSPLSSKPSGTHKEGAFSGLLSFLNMGDMSRVTLCVVMMFTVALLPGKVFNSASSADYSTFHGSARHLFTAEDPMVLSLSSFLLTACMQLFISWLCVGWLVALSLPLVVGPSSREYSTFGKFVQQARSCKQKVCVYVRVCLLLVCVCVCCLCVRVCVCCLCVRLLLVCASVVCVCGCASVACVCVCCLCVGVLHSLLVLHCLSTVHHFVLSAGRVSNGCHQLPQSSGCSQCCSAHVCCNQNGRRSLASDYFCLHPLALWCLVCATHTEEDYSPGQGQRGASGRGTGHV